MTGSVAVRLEQVVLGQLRRARTQRFELAPSGPKVLARALERAVAGPNAKAELQRFLQLIVALDGRLGSPDAAQALREVLRGCARARMLALRWFSPGAEMDRAQRFAVAQGARDRALAPRQDAAEPQDTLRVKDLMDPFGRRRDVGSPAGRAKWQMQ